MIIGKIALKVSRGILEVLAVESHEKFIIFDCDEAKVTASQQVGDKHHVYEDRHSHMPTSICFTIERSQSIVKCTRVDRGERFLVKAELIELTKVN